MITVGNIYNILFTTTVLFQIGLLGLALNRENVVKIIMSLELVLLAVNLNFIVLSLYLDDVTGNVFVIFILALSATESSIGLAILSVFYEKRGHIRLDLIKSKNKNLKF